MKKPRGKKRAPAGRAKKSDPPKTVKKHKKHEEHTQTMSVSNLAEFLNLGDRRIQSLVKEGMPRAKKGAYNFLECVRWYVRYLQERIRSRALPDDGEDSTGPVSSAAATRHKLLGIEAELKTLELAERREQLVSIDKVEKDFASLAMEIKTRILSLPPRLAAEVLGERDLAIAQTKIDRSLKGALESLAQYDPDARIA